MKQGRKRPLDTPKRKIFIERRRERKIEGEIEREGEIRDIIFPPKFLSLPSNSQNTIEIDSLKFLSFLCEGYAISRCFN